MKMKKFLVCMILLALYLNSGWAIATYYNNNIFSHSPGTFVQSILAGPGEADLFRGNHLLGTKEKVYFMIVWPFIIFIIIAAWIIYGIYWLLWLIFAGGIAKLLGVG